MRHIFSIVLSQVFNVHLLHSAMLNNGEIFGQEKEKELMLDETTVFLSLSKLRMVSVCCTLDYIRRTKVYMITVLKNWQNVWFYCSYNEKAE